MRDDGTDNPYFDQKSGQQQKAVKTSRRYEQGSGSLSSKTLDIFVDIKK